MFKEIYEKLTRTYKIGLEVQDNQGQTALHVAALSKNQAFFEVVVADLKKMERSRLL